MEGDDTAHLWLEQKMDEHNENATKDVKGGKLDLPLKSDGTEYKVTHIKGDQEDVACEVFSKLKEWLEFQPANNDDKFEPLLMTVSGVAGTGKTVLIKTVVTAIRKMFRFNNSVLVFSPTGAAAHNAGGTTFHRGGTVKVKNIDWEMTEKQREKLRGLYNRTVALIGDERSLLQSGVLGAFERNISKTAHGGGHDTELFGGIPIVILIGNDGQLPPPVSPGAFESVPSSNWSSRMSCKLRGDLLFHTLSEKVMELTKLKRQDENDDVLVSILENARTDKISNKQADILESLHLSNFTAAQQKEIKDKSIFLFATKEPMRDFNLEQLDKESSENNPVAFIKSKVSVFFSLSLFSF